MNRESKLFRSANLAFTATMFGELTMALVALTSSRTITETDGTLGDGNGLAFVLVHEVPRGYPSLRSSR